MTLSEIPSWKKWGLHGVFEWHENQIITMRLLHLSDAKRKKNPYVRLHRYAIEFSSFESYK
jgi:hypothetical protein